MSRVGADDGQDVVSGPARDLPRGRPAAPVVVTNPSVSCNDPFRIAPVLLATLAARCGPYVSERVETRSQGSRTARVGVPAPVTLASRVTGPCMVPLCAKRRPAGEGALHRAPCAPFVPGFSCIPRLSFVPRLS